MFRMRNRVRYQAVTDPARITTPERRPEDLDAALRPKALDEFVGQKAAK